MNGMFEYRPYSKAMQLGQKEKDMPKLLVKKPKKKTKNRKKKLNYKGVDIPTRAKRGEFTVKHKSQIIDLYGNVCLVCGNPNIEFHHRKFRSGLGRNNPRNGAPLCNTHHREAHENAGFAQLLRQEAIERFGEFYFLDKYDLWKAGKIDRPIDELFERFFDKERERIEQTRDLS